MVRGRLARAAHGQGHLPQALPVHDGFGIRHPGTVRGTRTRRAAGLLRGRNSRGLTRLADREVVIDADAAQIPVGVDGEALVLDTPVRCTVQPAALRVRVPRDRPGVPDPTPVMDWNRLWRMALTGPGSGRA